MDLRSPSPLPFLLHPAARRHPPPPDLPPRCQPFLTPFPFSLPPPLSVSPPSRSIPHSPLTRYFPLLVRVRSYYSISANAPASIRTRTHTHAHARALILPLPSLLSRALPPRDLPFIVPDVASPRKCLVSPLISRPVAYMRPRFFILLRTIDSRCSILRPKIDLFRVTRIPCVIIPTRRGNTSLEEFIS